MKLTCNKCGKEFAINQDMLNESYLGAMITETSFSCPKCGEKYITCIKNTKCRRLQRKIEELREVIRIKHIKKDYPIPEIFEVDELSKEVKKEMDRINGKVRWE